MTNHPITPPPELVEKWVAEIWHEGTPIQVSASDIHIATQAARWGSDQELEACCEYMQHEDFHGFAKELRAARRPKPPSLKKRALSEVAAAIASGNMTPERGATIRLALEQLDD